MSSPEGAPPSTRTKDSKEICPQCKDLDLENLLGSLPPLHRRPTIKALVPHQHLYEEALEANEKRRKYKILCGTRILQRLAFEEENPAQLHCWICQRIREFDEGFSVKTCSWRRLDNSSILAPIKELNLRIAVRNPSILGGSPLQYSSLFRKVDFGIGSHLKSSQRLLPEVHITSKTPDYSKVKGWLSHCLAHHSQCEKPNTDALAQIPGFRLFDINRRCVVPYTEGDAFVALSYVWGSGYLSSEKGSSSLDTTDPERQTYPLTIEHAILIVRNIGYQFMWIDSICIDQKNEAEKMQQIGQMHIVYGSAIATLIPLHSPHAGYGIPGVVQDDSQRALKHERLTQIEARLGTKGEMVVHSFHPPLNSDLQDSVWGRRGWTYQEGLLSQRRIFVTRYQFHFVCNEMYCAEDNSSSGPKILAELEGTVNPLKPKTIGSRHEVFRIYCLVVISFRARLLTNQDDSLNAVSAILAKLQTEGLKAGFIYGIPREGFRTALLWSRIGPYAPSTKRLWVASNSRIHFPTWSWCGWQHEILVDFEIFYNLEKKCHLNPTLWISWKGQPIILPSKHAGSKRELGYEEIQPAAYEDPIWRLVEDLAKQDAAEPNFFDSQFDETALRVKGSLLTLPLFLEKQKNGRFRVKCRFFRDGNVREDIELQIAGTESQTVPYDCLIMSMWTTKHLMNFKGILLQWDTRGHDPAHRVATRVGQVDYVTEREYFKALWHDLDPRMEEFWLL